MKNQNFKKSKKKNVIFTFRKKKKRQENITKNVLFQSV